MERINIFLVILVGCASNEVNGVTRDGVNHNFGHYFWNKGSVGVNISYRLIDLESGGSEDRVVFDILSCIGWKRYISCGSYFQVHVHLLYDMDIIGGCPGTRTTRG